MPDSYNEQAESRYEATCTVQFADKSLLKAPIFKVVAWFLSDPNPVYTFTCNFHSDYIYRTSKNIYWGPSAANLIATEIRVKD